MHLDFINFTSSARSLDVYFVITFLCGFSDKQENVMQVTHCKIQHWNINSQDRTRNNGFKLDKFRFRKEMGRNWFSNWIVDEWNRLSSHIVSAKTSNGELQRLGKFMDEDDRWNEITLAASLIFERSYVFI